MISKIKEHPQLKPFIQRTCSENEVSVTMRADISQSDFLVLKVDNYYNSLNLGHRRKTPPSVDCLVPLKCSDDAFVIYLIELKNIKSPKGFTIKNIHNKFKVTIEHFMSQQFNGIFLDPGYRVKKLMLYFVTNPYRLSSMSHRREGTKMDALLARSVFRFKGKRYQLQQELPNPVIETC